MRFLLGILGLAVTMSAVQAQDATPVCTNAGVTYKVGDTACLPACHGAQRYAKCEVVGTSASWTTISDVCPVAMIDAPRWRDWSVASPVPRAIDTVAATLAPGYAPLGG